MDRNCRNRFLKIGIVLGCLVIGGACNEEDLKGTPSEWPWTDLQEPDKPTEANPAIVALGWTNVGDTYGELPEYMQVYKSPEKLENKRSVAYIAVADMASARFQVVSDVAYSNDAGWWVADKVKTLTQFYEITPVPVLVNGGLFYWGEADSKKGYYYSQSLVIRGGELLSPNFTYYSEDWDTYWYPTLGAFCQLEDGSFKATWTYYTAGGINYCYPQPADNSMDKRPLEVPSADFPEGAGELKAKTGIGGVSVLIREGEIKNTYVQELLNIAADSDQPRTAIGITADKKMILFVCEGRQKTEGVAGLTTADVARVMKALGCVEALNLDGGGSSCMLVNGHETIKPSDGEQRAVLSAVSLE